MQRHRIALAALLFASGLPLSAQQWTSANEELLRSARLWEARDRGDLAVVALEKLANARPDDADVLRRLGELQLRIGDAEGAKVALTSGLAAAPNNVDIMLSLGDMEARRQKPDDN